MKNKQWLLKSRPEGMFKTSDFEEKQSEIEELKEGEALFKNLYLSFDPTQRGWAAVDTYLPAVPLNTVMRAIGIAQVIESKTSKFKKGDIVGGLVNWQEYFVVNKNDSQMMDFFVIPPYIDLQLVLAFMGTGLTAYFGLKEVGKPKAGETVLVSGAAGATGSIVGQIARIQGARVIGIAGGKEKCQWLKEVAHFDDAIDYKNEDVEKRIGELCPNGINLYFDNVGGEILDAALLHLALRGRVVICGQISQYDKINPKGVMFSAENVYGVKAISMLIMKRATMQGFLITDYLKNSAEGLLCLNQWVNDGKVIQQIDLKEGFDNIPETLLRVFQGKNIGKQLLKLSDPPLPLNKTFLGEILFSIYQKWVFWTKSTF
jgi:NADPH-dependent curcumin reductase CurA